MITATWLTPATCQKSRLVVSVMEAIPDDALQSKDVGTTAAKNEQDDAQGSVGYHRKGRGGLELWLMLSFSIRISVRR